jgi:hypothetical protein
MVDYISYSASNTLLSCQRRYYLEKVIKAPVDADYSDSKDALQFGKAYHSVLEWTKHDSKLYEEEYLNTACAENNIDGDTRYKVFASVIAYYNLRKASKLKCIASEIKIGNEQLVGYIDAILIDSYGHWWICDLKTSGMIQENMFARLNLDPQLNLYAHFADKVAEELSLDMDQYLGARYCVVGKTRIKIKSGESLTEFAARADVACHEIETLKEDMDPAGSYGNMMKLLDKANSLTVESIIPNRGACLNYNSPCPFWSHCHTGMTYSECLQNVTSFNRASMNDRTRVPQIPTEEDVFS